MKTTSSKKGDWKMKKFERPELTVVELVSEDITISMSSEPGEDQEEI